jgi:hypothetical protein
MFAEFRRWATTAGTAERARAAVAALVALALGVYLLVPAQRPRTEAASAGNGGGVRASGTPSAPGQSTAPAAGAAVSVTPSSAPAGGASVSQSSASSAGVPASPVAGGRCVSPPGQAHGVTASQIKIAIALTQVLGPAANSVFGIPQADEQKNDYQAVIDDINRSGGIACRSVVASYYIINPADQNGMHQQCLDIVASGVYAVLDAGGFASITTEPLTCFATHGLPYFGAYLIPAWQAQKYYPYIIAFSTFETLYRDTAFGLKSLGYFDPAKGFKKLGYFYHDCDLQRVGVFRNSLRDAGIADSSIVPYNFGCPAAFASPSDIEQAILRFEQAGVTHVVEAGAMGDIANFTKTAQLQGFHPKYGFPDEALVQISYGNLRADPMNMNGAIAVTTSRNGENTTPGLTPSAGTVRCNAILSARGLRTPYQEPSGAGNSCSLVWMFQAAVDHAPSINATSLGTGLQAAKSVEFSFPQAPNDFSADRTISGGQFWRPLQYLYECQCWRVINAAFQPSFR